MANIITASRIIISIALLFFPALSPEFYALYLAAGITDMLDGTVARKTGKVSDFGANLDSIAEIKYTAISVCVVATFAAIQEGHLIRTGKI